MTATLDVTTPSPTEIRVVRAFDAPAKLVFDFHTKPELVQKWLLGPPGWTMPVCEIDLRPGGRYQYRWRNDDGTVEFGVQGEYQVVTAPTRFENLETMDGQDGEVYGISEFTESAGKTTLTLTMRFPSQALRDIALESGMTDGMAMSYDRLAGFLK